MMSKWKLFNPTVILFVLFVAYLILLFDFKASCSTETHEYHIEYHGLIWVALDNWTIYKYKSTDQPQHWITITTKSK
jgi:hypothetical protein